MAADPSGRVAATVGIPAKTADVIREELGVDLTRPDEADRLDASLRMSVSHSPYPSPDVLAAYERELPGRAKLVVAAIDEQRRHRLELESLAARQHEDRLNRAQRNALAVAVLGIPGAVARSLSSRRKPGCWGHGLCGAARSRLVAIPGSRLFILLS